MSAKNLVEQYPRPGGVALARARREDVVHALDVPYGPTSTAGPAEAIISSTSRGRRVLRPVGDLALRLLAIRRPLARYILASESGKARVWLALLVGP